MTAALTLLVKFGPWLGMALAGLVAWISMKSSKTAVAVAQQKQAVAETTVAQVQTATATANQVVADTSKQAVQNASDAAALVAATSAADNRKALQDEFGRQS